MTFKTAPDFENPADEDGDNIYKVWVTATDPGALSDELQQTVTVADVNEAPAFPGSLPIDSDVPENQAFAFTAAPTDPDADDTLSYAISGGDDAALFSVNPATGRVAFTHRPDYENPRDDDADNIYLVAVTATDLAGLGTDSRLHRASVLDNSSEPAFLSASAVSIAEHHAAVVTLSASNPSGGELMYFIDGGADEDLFELNALNGDLSFRSAPDFEFPQDATRNNVYELTVKATDFSDWGKGYQDLAVTVTDTATEPTITSSDAISVAENHISVLTATATNPAGGTLAYSIAGGLDGSLFEIDEETG
ncbi:MAG: hypothetical protein GY720_06965, partial [bacterium]|nr:hypothetical protein [bacterium]